MITLSFSCSPERSTRGQTEPLAALIAISTIALAIGVYGGFFTDVMDTQTERDVSEPTLAGVWHTIGADSIYENGELIGTDVPAARLPKGYNVYVNVTVLKPSGWTELESVTYDKTGKASDASTFDVSDVASYAQFASRSIPYQKTGGQVVSARLNVVIWKA